MYRGMFNAGLGAAYLPDGNPINLHFVMFLPTLMGQGTPDQISDVRPNYCKKNKMKKCYPMYLKAWPTFY